MNVIDMMHVRVVKFARVGRSEGPRAGEPEVLETAIPG